MWKGSDLVICSPLTRNFSAFGVGHRWHTYARVGRPLFHEIGPETGEIPSTSAGLRATNCEKLSEEHRPSRRRDLLRYPGEWRDGCSTLR